jgi:hypothetical protein
MSQLSMRIHRALGSQAVEESKAIHAYLHAVNYSREEWDTLWLNSENTTWAHGFGRMVGFDEVYYNSVFGMDRQILDLRMKATENCPEEYLIDFMGADLRSGGFVSGHLLASPIIEVAEDGKSARCSYLTPGGGTGAMFRVLDKMEQPAGSFLWERYGSDFVYVDGRWQWFHEQVCPDIDGRYDTSNWAYENYQRMLKKPEPMGELGGHPPKLTEPDIIHFDFSPIQPVQDTVPPPKPYETLDDDNSYSKGRNTY